jgi:hypothetical protein
VSPNLVFVTGLRDAADWIQAHPGLPVPPALTIGYAAGTPVTVQAIASRFGLGDVIDDGHGLCAERTFGPVTYRVSAYRDFQAYIARVDELHARNWADANGYDLVKVRPGIKEPF